MKNLLCFGIINVQSDIFGYKGAKNALEQIQRISEQVPIMMVYLT